MNSPPRSRESQSPNRVMTTKKTPSVAREVTIPPQLIERRIYLIHGQKVVLDSDLAKLYRVPTKRLNDQVTRNIDRFPEVFMFPLDREEADALRSQIATSKTGRGGRRYLTRVLTEQGVAMVSSVLRSERGCPGKYRHHARVRASPPAPGKPRGARSGKSRPRLKTSTTLTSKSFSTSSESLWSLLRKNESVPEDSTLSKTKPVLTE